MASLQTTIVYLSRSVYAMGRDGVLPAAIGTLDRRGTPTASIVLVGGVVLAFTLVTGFSQSARDAYDVVLSGSAIFLGALFLFSTAAAARTFARDRHERLTGVVVPLVATAALGAILVVAVLQSDGPTRGFILAGTLLGLPLAAWRSRRSLTRGVGTSGAGPESAKPAV
jgi:amino acid transporter